MSLTSLNKKFSKALCDKYDPMGKAHTIKIMEDVKGAKLIAENEGEEKQDFSEGYWDQQYELPDGTQVYVESEMKDAKWWGEHWGSEEVPFRWDTMDIPFRKVKNKSELHVLISMCGEYGFIVTRQKMNEAVEHNGGPKFKTTKYEPDGGFYFNPPIEDGEFIHLRDGKWKLTEESQ